MRDDGSHASVRGPARRAAAVAAALTAVLLAAGCGGGSSPAAQTPAGTTAGPAHLVSLPRGSTTTAGLDLESGVSAVDVTTADLHGQLMTAITPGNAGIVPSLTTGANGIVRVDVPHAAGGGGPARLVVVLDRSVTWSVFLDGGASTERVDLRGARANVVDLGAGVSRAAVMLPRPTGTDLIRMTGGASTLVIGVPRGSPTRVHVKGGASSVRIGSVSHTGVGGPATYDSHGYAGATDRIDLEIETGVSALVVRPY
jgi:hypothetical protein